VSLRRSPIRSAAFLSANRCNSLKSTGPRTIRGKARSCLNGLKHGERSYRLGEKLVAAGDYGGAWLHARVRAEIESVFGARCPEEGRQAERLANAVYAMFRRTERLRAKPECRLFSARLGPRVSRLFRISVNDPATRVGLCYWVQRKGYWNCERVMAAMYMPETMKAERPLGEMLEGRVRRRLYRMRKPGLWERIAYGLSDIESTRQKPEGTEEDLKFEIGDLKERKAESTQEDLKSVIGNFEEGKPERAEEKLRFEIRDLKDAKPESAVPETVHGHRSASRSRPCQGRPQPDLIRQFNANGGRWWRMSSLGD